mmetsp:Transcript_7685/g.10474  ORF Transcript_7685/g.10474 Transcript_7685/m.10474 type:complete len:362 (-) Transcript_7685:96-1181(-)|eukprot:CAMPEP_0185725666 /NCGR_PEP_ID=MMETSP1171-20130828/1873_1 /TAXON_ID=374046 /ORGANISM="Helicotheca tamensis, Strain CCMP826" /LENGTH=361 /DNA_ID=CAMNT_0028393853 /DNA_START=84 /DNA_END=1169 /DNA_ORIENTATION=+
MRASTAIAIISISLSTIKSSHSFAFSKINNNKAATSSTAIFAKKKVFIDGEAGTTGLQVRERLGDREDIEIISPPSELRKDEETRKKFINEADAVILCLPDAASIEAVSFVDEDNERTVLIDASTAFRVDEDWTYGFPELSTEQREALTKSRRISNPGCYPTGFIALTRLLVDAGIIEPGTPLTCNAISGYTGGGKGLMGVYEGEDHEPWGAYGFSLQHKHIPEMAKYSGLGKNPIFQPAVASFDQGMVVSVPLHYEWLKAGKTGKDMHDALSAHYANSKFVEVMPLGESGVKESDLLERGAFLRPDTLKNTNKLQLFVFDNDDAGQVVLCARLDNLGKGASGAAVQNLNIALGFDEGEGL